LRDIWDKY